MLAAGIREGQKAKNVRQVPGWDSCGYATAARPRTILVMKPMSDAGNKYSRLAPLPLEQRITLCLLAAAFFSPINYKEMCDVVGRTPGPKIQPFDDMDFFSFLEKKGFLPEVFRYRVRILELLDRLESARILVRAGQGRGSGGGHFYFMHEVTTKQKLGRLWLTPALGAEFVRQCFSTITLQITGIAKNGNPAAGTGLAISPNWILTCAHVVKDMKLDDTQEFAGKTIRVIEAISDGDADVGLIKTDSPLPQLPGIVFRDPIVAEAIVTLGYPRIPLSRNAVLVMHRGEVTSELLQTVTGEQLFLYSAIARPGNSGGPVIANDGSIIGIVSDELGAKNEHESFPFFAGIRASEIAAAIARLTSEVQLPMEDYG